jgi:hypothetical protein
LQAARSQDFSFLNVHCNLLEGISTRHYPALQAAAALTRRRLSSASNLKFRFFGGFLCRLDRASLGNARKNPDQSERCRTSRVGSGYIQPKPSAEACLAGKDRPIDSGRPTQRRNHAANRKAKTVIWRWQERFSAEGVASLWRDKTRPSRIPPLAPEVAERVVALTLAGPPPDETIVAEIDANRACDGWCGFV